MKKVRLLLTVTAIIVAGNTAILTRNSSALYKEDTKTWWTVEELLEFKQIVDTEMSEKCGKDFGCRDELYFQRLGDYNNQYVALDRLEESQFHITSINQEQGIMKALYFDHDAFMNRMGEEWHDPLRHIFLAWFDDLKNSSEIGRYYYEYPPEQIFSNIPHIIYRSNDENFPIAQEFILPVNNEETKRNPHGRVSFAVFANQFNSVGFIDYHTCLNEPDYSPGMECQLMISSDGESKYMPPRETILTTLQTVLPEEEITEQSPTTSVTLPEQAKNQTTITDEIKSPKTGVNEQSSGTARELPWWLIMIIILNIIVLAWFFWPNNKKSSKISKKPIDKIKHLR